MSAEPRYCYRHPDRETGLSCSECGRPICYECMTPAAVGLRCPEHSGKPQGIRRVQAAATGIGVRRPNLVTMVLIGINLAVYALELALGGNINGQNNWVYDHGVLIKSGEYCFGCQPIGVAHGEWWRLITAAFLHYGPLHLGLNMFSLYFAGSILETVIGRWRFVLLYVVAGLAGSAGALYVNPNSISAGASGAIFGVLGGLLVLERRGSIATGGQVLGLIVLNLVLTFAIPGISIGAHIGGLIAGIVVMLGFSRFRRSPQLSIAAAAAVALVAVLVAYAAA
ncbi:MAG TPA: rhomboid family intramembrane serine protease [Gaiellaceae bacterium]|nr:rhomboid family intramembrane serine protease [Gaiellaceae bacterium]